MNRLVAPLLVALVLPGNAIAEFVLPWPNVRDPARSAKQAVFDDSLPSIYFDPHDPCYDVAGPLRVTITATNSSYVRSLTVDWDRIVGALVLDAVGPGRVAVVRDRPALKAVELPTAGFVPSSAQITIDLRDWFKVEGAGVYRLTYARPLSDGRIHISNGAKFVIEDDAAVDKLAAALPAGLARETVAAMLKDNPTFTGGGGYRSDERAKAFAAAQENWRKGMERLTRKDAPAGSALAVEVLIDRLLYLSDNFRADPGSHTAADLSEWVRSLPPADGERLDLKLIRSRSPWVVRWSIRHLGRRQSNAGLAELFRIGDGPDRELAEEALGELSNYEPDLRIAAYLRRKMAAADPAVALHAALVSCYSGDASGGSVVVRFMTSDDPALRLRAIAKVGNEKYFRPHRDAIVRALLAELKAPTTDDHLERAIDSLGSYPTAEVLKAVTPFATHANEQVSGRARMTLSEIMREKERK